MWGINKSQDNMDIKNIIENAKGAENWSANHKFNYGPIKYLEREVKTLEVFSDSQSGGTRFNIFYKNVSKVTDPKTFLAYELCRFDIYVRVTDIIYVMGRTFPEVNEGQIMDWVFELKNPEQVLVF